jgi:hypothetical protein
MEMAKKPWSLKEFFLQNTDANEDKIKKWKELQKGSKKLPEELYIPCMFRDLITAPTYLCKQPEEIKTVYKQQPLFMKAFHTWLLVEKPKIEVITGMDILLANMAIFFTEN